MLSHLVSYALSNVSEELCTNLSATYVDFTQIRPFLKLALPFEFVIDGPPVSQQAHRRERVRQWRDEVRRVAEQYWPSGELPASGPVLLSVTYFYESGAMDIDNLLKPILDALKGLNQSTRDWYTHAAKFDGSSAVIFSTAAVTADRQ